MPGCGMYAVAREMTTRPKINHIFSFFPISYLIDYFT